MWSLSSGKRRNWNSFELKYLDFDEVHGFKEGRLSGQLTGVEDSSRGGDDLATTTMDGVGVQCDIVQVESDSSHVLLAQHTL